MKHIRCASPWSLFLVLTITALFILGSSCRRSSKAKENQASLKKPEPAEAMEAKKAKAPEAGLTLNRQGDEVDTYPGWPVLVELSVRHPQLYATQEKVEPLVIASRGDSWAQAVTLTVKDAKDAIVNFSFKPVPLSGATLTLDAEKTGAASWWLAGEDAVGIPEGDYKLTATIDTSDVNKAGMWKGKVVSEPVVLHFKKEPSPLSDELAEEKQLLLSACAQGLGDDAKAGQYLDALLKAQPESIQGVAMKAGWLERAGDKAGAKEAYEKAIALFGRKHPHAEPPPELWQNYNRLIHEMLEKTIRH